MMRRYPAMLNLVRDCFNQGKPVAAICHAGWVPASAGILKGKTATCFFAIKDDLINAGAKYVDEEVVVDGSHRPGRRAICRPSARVGEGGESLPSLPGTPGSGESGREGGRMERNDPSQDVSHPTEG
jgi:hypothetical protein